MFKVQPALVKGFNTVVLLREDFENLLNLANLWLSHNPEDQYHKISSSTSATSNEDSGNIYICNDQRQFITNHFHYSMGTEEEFSATNFKNFVDWHLKDNELKLDSPILGSLLSKSGSPLSFLSSRLSQFTKATRIFTTRDYTHTNVAAEFHQACDNIPNTLVIIKSGQYIAGGYTEVAWESPIEPIYKPAHKSFLFSVNTEEVFNLVVSDHAVTHFAHSGPVFGRGCGDLGVHGDYKLHQAQTRGGHSLLSSYQSTGVLDLGTALFGSRWFQVDEYEVYKLE